MNNVTATLWLHGTERGTIIDEWKFPPPPMRHKSELTPHTAIFFTTDKTLALGAGPKLYATKIRPEAKIIDLREPTAESEAFRQMVVQGKYGRDHYFATAEYWTRAWQQGEVMRFGSDKPHRVEEAQLIMQAKTAVDRGDRSPEALALLLKGQNRTREWIEEIVSAGRKLGYDAIIGVEPDTYRPGGRALSEILFALNSRAITPPIAVP